MSRSLLVEINKQIKNGIESDVEHFMYFSRYPF